MSTELTYTPATELVARIRRGTLSPVTLLEACLERIDALDDEINAFVTVRDDDALAEAERAEAAVESGEPIGPLHGIPVAIKDLTQVAGVRTTYGSTLFSENVSETDDPLVERLRAAGAIVIGKTNTPEFGRKPMTVNEVAGATANPWNTTRTAGGSSGGSAAALAAGMVPIAQGSDAAGSIRIPASACGVYGLMPDFGRVPLGSRPDAFVNTHPYTFVGPMTRSVEDAALVLDVIAGPHPDEPFSLPERSGQYVESVRAGVDDLEIAYSPDLGVCAVDSAVQDVVADAADGFREAGATVDRIGSGFDDWETPHDAIETLLQDRYLGLYDNLRRDEGIDLLDRREEVTAEVISRIEKALELTPLDVRRAERDRTVAFDAINDIFEEYDVLVTPTLGMAPFEKETKPTSIAGESIDPLHGWALTWPLNLTGHPAASVPAGFVDGLPVGLQIVAPRGRDDRVLAASAAFERVRPWSYPPNEL